jgi:hypothetical protein
MGRKKGLLSHCWWDCKLIEPLWKTVWSFLKKLKLGPAISHLSIHPKEMKSVCQRDICPPMFIVALLTIAHIWKQPECLTTEEWVKKIYIQMLLIQYTHHKLKIIYQKCI